MVVKDGVSITLKENSKLTSIEPSIHGNDLHLTAPGMDSCKISLLDRPSWSTDTYKCVYI